MVDSMNFRLFFPSFLNTYKKLLIGLKLFLSSSAFC